MVHDHQGRATETPEGGWPGGPRVDLSWDPMGRGA